MDFFRNSLQGNFHALLKHRFTADQIADQLMKVIPQL